MTVVFNLLLNEERLSKTLAFHGDLDIFENSLRVLLLIVFFFLQVTWRQSDTHVGSKKMPTIPVSKS